MKRIFHYSLLVSSSHFDNLSYGLIDSGIAWKIKIYQVSNSLSYLYLIQETFMPAPNPNPNPNLLFIEKISDSDFCYYQNNQIVVTLLLVSCE